MTATAGQARERLVVIGNGMASLRLVEQVVARAPRRYAITMIGSEARPAYNRVLLSSLLSGESDEASISLKPASWYEAQGIELLCGTKIARIDTRLGRVATASGTSIAYDRLVIATGSQPIRLPLPGSDLPGVVTFRDFDDVVAMTSRIKAGEPAIVIGGGLLGIEAAFGLSRLGARVTLIHVMDRLMERQLDQRGAAFLKSALEKRGIKVVLQAQTSALCGSAQVEVARLADGRSLPASLVVMAVGIKPNAELAREAGLACARGILIDSNMLTSLHNIYAIGECAEHRGIVHGLVEPAHMQAEALAATLCGAEGRFEGWSSATNLKASGVPVFSAGDFQGESSGAESVVMEARAAGLYRKLVFAGDRLAGCVLVGNSEDGLWYRDLIRSGQAIGAMRRDLIHGRAYAEPARDQAA